MTRITHMLLAAPLAALVAGAYMLMAWPGASEAEDGDYPAPIAALANRGLDIVDSFEAPGELTGYAATFRGRPMAIYLTPDGEHALLGTLVDGDGTDLTAKPLERIVSGPKNNDAWERLADSTWVRDGDEDAERIVYELTDPNCPYCNQFWQTARPWVEAGDVQIRHVMVGILKADSVPKAATIVAADDPGAALERHERNYASGGITVADDIPENAQDKVRANNVLMSALGYFATPTILYRDANGEIAVKQGMPRGEDVEQILGPKP